MFSDIEKEYKKGLQERRFVAFYWPKAIFIVLLAILGDLLFHFDRWLVYGFSVAILWLLSALSTSHHSLLPPGFSQSPGPSYIF